MKVPNIVGFTSVHFVEDGIALPSAWKELSSWLYNCPLFMIALLCLLLGKSCLLGFTIGHFVYKDIALPSARKELSSWL